MTDRSVRRRVDADGFTTIELMVALMIMMVVVAIAGTVLFSISAAANRNDNVVSLQQKASNILAQLSRDIRSASSISFPLSTPASQVELVDNQVSGSTMTSVPVIWLYTSDSSACTKASVTAPCLIRETQVSGTFTPNPSLSISLANNTSTHPVFSYYSFSSPGTALPTTDTMSYFSTCTTAINVDLVVSGTSDNLKSSFEDTDQVALTNQLNTLTAPGNGLCR